MLSLKRFAILLLMYFLAQSQSLGYDQAGHFYTSAAIANATDKKEQLWPLVTFCSQLPDMASDFDAAAVYKSLVFNHPIDWAQWGRSEKINSDEVRKMITVQQTLHALTGGDPAAVNEVGTDTVLELHAQFAKTKAKTMACALGLALHFLGDTYAHRKLTELDASEAEKNIMYGTGMGHASDLHYPDYVLCDALQPSLLNRIFYTCSSEQTSKGRYRSWIGLWEPGFTQKSYDPPGSIPNGNVRSGLLSTVDTLRLCDPHNWNDYKEEDMRKILAGGKLISSCSIDSEKTDESQKALFSLIEDTKNGDWTCEKVLIAGKKIPNLAELISFTCDEVWTTYSGVVNKKFDAVSQKGLPVRRLGDKVMTNEEAKKIYCQTPLSGKDCDEYQIKKPVFLMPQRTS